jgi:predicted RNase H-like nuclease
MNIVGVDSCPRGWIAVSLDTATTELVPRFFSRFVELLEAHADTPVIAVDIPIGLNDGKPRACDIDARKRLGWPGMASVFPAPARSMIGVTDYREAKEESRARFGHAVTRQSFSIYRKVAEVDAAMSPELQTRVHEVHPELSFWAMNGRNALQFGKKTQAGFEDRLELIAQQFVGFNVPADRAQAKAMAPLAGVDDLLDAIAAVWTARRIAEGSAEQFPADPESDERGLRMQIAV